MKRIRIKIDYKKCGDEGKTDPRNCTKCLKVCDPCVFVMHETINAKEANQYDPQHWRITPVWPSVCTKCHRCVEACPEQAISVSW